MTDIRDFITDRLHEDQTAADGALSAGSDHDGVAWDAHSRDAITIDNDESGLLRSFIDRFSPERIQHAVAAQLTLLADHEPDFADDVCCRCSPNYMDDYVTTAGNVWPCLTVRALAASWPDHPDYDPSWIVEHREP